MRFLMGFLVTVGALVGAPGCGVAIRAGADFDRDAGLPSYSTFAWDEPSDRPNADPLLERDPLFESRLHEAITREFAMRGVRFRESSPEMLVHHHLSVVEHAEVLEADPAIDSEYFDEPRVFEYEEGFFSVHVVDARTGENLWLGWANGDIGRALSSAQWMEEWINEAVGMMFEQFPTLAGEEMP